MFYKYIYEIFPHSIVHFYPYDELRGKFCGDLFPFYDIAAEEKVSAKATKGHSKIPNFLLF